MYRVFFIHLKVEYSSALSRINVEHTKQTQRRPPNVGTTP